MITVKQFEVPPDGKWHTPPTDKRIGWMQAPLGCEVGITPGKVRNTTDRPLMVDFVETNDG
jgi:hypothetical protein